MKREEGREERERGEGKKWERGNKENGGERGRVLGQQSPIEQRR